MAPWPDDRYTTSEPSRSAKARKDAAAYLEPARQHIYTQEGYNLLQHAQESRPGPADGEPPSESATDTAKA